MKILFMFLGLVSFISGCAVRQQDNLYPRPQIKKEENGISHRVEKGQTLWMIAKAYNVDLKTIVNVNQIYDPSQIKSGQVIFIPYGKREVYEPYLNKSSLTMDESFIWPLQGKVISLFKQNNNDVINRGIDILAPYGTKVMASRSGIVSFSEQINGLGKTIIIDHGNDFLTVYARNSEVLVMVGDKVAQGNVIAKVGAAGRDKRSFLHFEIRNGHTPQNPYYFLP